MNHFGINWWENEEKKRQERLESEEVSRINRLLQHLLHRVGARIDREKYQEEADEANRRLDRCEVWDISYANNMESPDVALEQALFIVAIALNEQFEDAGEIRDEAERYVRQLGNADWAKVGEYNERVRRLEAENETKKNANH